MQTWLGQGVGKEECELQTRLLNSSGFGSPGDCQKKKRGDGKTSENKLAAVLVERAAVGALLLGESWL